MFARRTGWSLTQNRYSAHLSEARASGATLIDLTASNPTHCKFNFDSAAILSAISRPESVKYEPDPQGLLSARKAVVAYYRASSICVNDLELSPEQIFLTTGTSEAYSYLFRLLCDPGDEVLVPQPSYPLFDYLADIQDVQFRAYELFYDHGWHLDLAGLESALTPRTRAVLVVNPNNPTGSFVHRTELEQLASLCRERHLALISDEVFLDYGVEHSAEVSAAFSSECLSFALNGLSKISCLPQMKLAWIVVNGPMRLRDQARERLQVIADTYLSVNTPIQHGLSLLLDERVDIQAQLIRRVRDNLAVLDEQLQSGKAMQRLVVEGGWYAVLRVPSKQTDEELAIDLMERCGVIVHPGHFYDFPGDGYIVLSLITPSDQFREGAQALSRFVERL